MKLNKKRELTTILWSPLVLLFLQRKSAHAAQVEEKVSRG